MNKATLTKTRNRYWLLFFLLIAFSCNEQGIDNDIPIVAKDLPEFPNAEVVYLLDEGVIEIDKDKTYKETVHYVMKINHEAGKEWADCSVGFNSKYQKATIDFARTITPDDVVIPIDKDAVKTATPFSDYPEYSDYKELTFTLPSVSVGSIIDYQYTIETGRLDPYRQVISSYQIQCHEPILKSRIVVTAPAEVKLNHLITNKKSEIDIKEKVEETKKKRICRWQTENIPRVKYEEDMPPLEDLAPRLLLTSEDSWGNIARWFNRLVGDKTKPDDRIVEETEEIVSDFIKKEDKIKAIYNFVSKEIRYVAVSYGASGYEPNPAPKILRNKYGDCKDKATLLISMLSVIDVPAYYAILPTNEMPELERGIPFLDQFDHCIVALKDNGRFFYMDPMTYNRYGDLPPMDQGRDVLIFVEDSHEFAKTDLYPSVQIVNSPVRLEENGETHITFKGSYQGYYDWVFRSTFVAFTEEEYKQFEDRVISEYKNSLMIDTQYSDPFDLNDPLSVGYTFKAEDHGQKLGDLWIVPNEDFSVNEYEKFALKERVHLLKLDRTDEERNHMEMTIPESYAVYYVPEKFEYHDSYYDIVSTYSETNGVVSWDYSFNRKAISIPKEGYQSLRETFQELVKHSEKQIVLKKVR